MSYYIDEHHEIYVYWKKKTVSMTNCTFVCVSCALWVCSKEVMWIGLPFWDLCE